MAYKEREEISHRHICEFPWWSCGLVFEQVMAFGEGLGPHRFLGADFCSATAVFLGCR